MIMKSNPKTITTRNPYSNDIMERIHQVTESTTRSFELESKCLDSDYPWKEILSAVSFYVRSTISTTTKRIPEPLVFSRDIMLNITHEENWEFIRVRKKINKNNEK